MGGGLGMIGRAVFPALLPVLILAGCSGGNEAAPLEVELIRTGQSIVSGIGKPAPAAPPLTRALLDTVEEPVLEVTLERKNLTAFLTLDAGGRDDRGVSVWRTTDNVTLSTRNGILVATRGLGGDLLSSTVQVAGRQPGPASGGAHVQMIRSLDARQVRLPMVCELADLGPETIEIVERNHPTRRLQQRCAGGGGTIVNDYWVDPGAGLVWQSRQWAGPHIGYMRFRRLIVQGGHAG